MPDYAGAVAYETAIERKPGLHDLFLLAYYHLHVMRWFTWALIALCFFVSGGILWLMVQIHYPLQYRQELSRFIMEAGAGLIACMIGGTLIVNDSGLELLLTSRQGIKQILIMRMLISWCIPGFLAVLFAIWSLWLGVHYFQGFSWWRLFCMWFVPTWLYTQLSLLGALFTKQAMMGGVLGGSLLLLELFMKDLFLHQTQLLWIFVPISMWLPDAGIWWQSRALLFALGGLLMGCSWWWLQREERLLGAIIS